MKVFEFFDLFNVKNSAFGNITINAHNEEKEIEWGRHYDYKTVRADFDNESDVKEMIEMFGNMYVSDWSIWNNRVCVNAVRRMKS